MVKRYNYKKKKKGVFIYLFFVLRVAEVSMQAPASNPCSCCGWRCCNVPRMIRMRLIHGEDRKREKKRKKEREKRGKMTTQKITLMKFSEAESVCFLKLMSFKNILGWERGKECVCGERVIILVLQ